MEKTLAKGNSASKVAGTGGEESAFTSVDQFCQGVGFVCRLDVETGSGGGAQAELRGHPQEVLVGSILEADEGVLDHVAFGGEHRAVVQCSKFPADADVDLPFLAVHAEQRPVPLRQQPLLGQERPEPFPFASGLAGEPFRPVRQLGWGRGLRVALAMAVVSVAAPQLQLCRRCRLAS